MHYLIEFWQQYEVLFWWVATASLSMFVISLIIIPWLILRLPADYLRRNSTAPPLLPVHRTYTRIVARMLMNLMGTVLIIAGVVMLFIPGQGMLTILMGLMLMDFPRKRKLIRRLLLQPYIIRPVNNMRRKAGKEPLE